MNLTEYPTPRLDELKRHWTISRRRTKQATFAAEVFKSLARLEREAAAWRAVAEMFAFFNNHAQEEFDALKSQLTQP